MQATYIIKKNKIQYFLEYINEGILYKSETFHRNKGTSQDIDVKIQVQSVPDF